MAVTGRLRSAGAALRTGRWVNPDRLIGYPVVLLGASLVVAGLGIALGSGLRDALGRPIGTDFLSFWSVSRLVRQDRAGESYDPETLYALEVAIVGEGAPFYGWLYPPVALLLVAPLAYVPYLWALAGWTLVSISAYLSAIWRIVPQRRAILPVLAFPGVLLAVGHGQNSLIVGALLGWGISLLPRQPGLGGVLLGVVVFKPHMVLLIPFALLAGRYWRGLAAFTVTASLLVVASIAAWGTGTWYAFFDSAALAKRVLEDGLVGWERMVSPFAGARIMGVPPSLSWLIQYAVTLTVVAAVSYVWAGRSPHLLKMAVICSAVLLATPFALDYDSAVLGIAIAAMVGDGIARGFLAWERTCLALAWIAPLFWRPLAHLLSLPIAQVCLAMFFALVLRRAWSLRGAPEVRVSSGVSRR